MEPLSRCEVVKKVVDDRKCSLLLLITIFVLSLLTFLCEQEIIRGVCASSYIDETYEDKVRLKTSDAGIFVGLKQRLELPPPPPSPVLVRHSHAHTEELQADANDRNYSSEGDAAGTSDDEGGSRANSISSEWNRVRDTPTGDSRQPEVKVEDPVDPVSPDEEPREKTYYVFKGIPYAQPPVGNLRWKEPEVLDIKSAAQDNTKYKSVCTQWSREEKRVVGSQDCLYLNIFTPHLPPTLRRPFLPNPYTVQDIFYQKRHLYPVLIYVHGGDLISGSGNFYEGKKLLKNENVVLVTFNFRLGVFGFLSSGDGEIGGNFGLLDQIFAIKWVQKYIQRFGGNPSRVTIFGDVGYLLFSPLAVGLFQGAVWTSSSGSIFSPPGRGNRSEMWSPAQLTEEIGTRVGCPSGGSKEGVGRRKMIECLKLAPADDLVRAQQSLIKFHSYPRRFVPVVDVGWRDFPVMIDEPEALMEMGTLVKVPILAGVNHLEGYELLLDFTEAVGGYENLREVDKVKETLRENLRHLMEVESDGVYELMFEAVWQYYFGEEGSNGYGRGLMKRLLTLFGDVKSHAGFWTLTKNLTRNVKPPAFAYVFTHKVNELSGYFRDEVTVGNVSSALNRRAFPPWEDLHYVLSIAEKDQGSEDSTVVLPTQGGSNEGQDVEFIMAKILTSFAKYGTPKEAVSRFENWTRWRRIERNNIWLYDLSTQPGPMKSSFRSAEAVFWHETLPEIRRLAQEREQMQPYTRFFWLLVIVTFAICILVAALVVYCVCFR